MAELIMIKEKIKAFYGKNDMFILPAAKFLMTLLVLSLINGNIGFMSSLDNIFVVILVALMCSVMPSGVSVLLTTLIMVGHLYSLSLELAVVSLLIFLIMYLLYFRFTARYAGWVMLTLICCMMKIPYIVPVIAGLLSGLATIIPVVLGVIMYYIITFAKGYAKSIDTVASEDIFDNFKNVISGLLNKEIILIALALGITITVVYLIRRLSIDYAWIYAVIAGALTDFIVVLIGNLVMDTSVSVFGIIIGLILAILVGLVLYVTCFGVDYQRTERVQYEDDDYYYYVKAVPKYSVSVTNVKVKKINTQKKRRVVEDNDDYDSIDIDF